MVEMAAANGSISGLRWYRCDMVRARLHKGVMYESRFNDDKSRRRQRYGSSVYERDVSRFLASGKRGQHVPVDITTVRFSC